ncbi:MAG: ammonia-forming cytochrome c nitrite reductase subunit c552, partial [Planctomycetes bacterium]|nr:ammonia-forming cytochrome c nitrite reductase subunit c552 [Planctomycetota bacterium]
MTRLRLWLLVTGAVTIVAALGGVLARREPGPAAPPGTSVPAPPAGDAAGPDALAGSESCRPCHPAHHEAWRGSHHALAERPLDLGLDAKAFRPARTVAHGSLRSEIRERDGRLEVVTAGPGGTVQAYEPLRWIGVAPLEQLVVPFPLGRYQVTALAYDRARDEWFDVFGAEDRKPHEWGFWTNRGMTWNSMCAPCHTTGLRKGYDPEKDAYETRWRELGVGCEACHGPLSRHVRWHETRSAGAEPPGPPPPSAVLSRDLMLDACASCHGRRSALTAGFSPGEKLTDHYRPALPDETDLYYPDGQVRDENFEHASFLMSRMHGEAVRCTDCHEPHSAKLRLQGNDLCLSCHEGKVDPASHSRHDPAGPGGQCTGCHMPITVYMQRHPRRDHSFSIPDPLLTREAGIPNACNRCHTDKDLDWAIAAAERQFGARLERGTRARARAVARGRRGLAEAVPELAAMARDERSAAWRAVAAGLLARWADLPEVLEVLLRLLADPEPLPRAAAARALESAPEVREVLAPLLDDPSRLVRVEAAWTLRRGLDLSSRAGRDLLEALAQSADQPQGALQAGMLRLDRGDPREAEASIRRSIAWDEGSAPYRQALALALEAQGRPREAVGALEAAARLAP